MTQKRSPEALERRRKKKSAQYAEKVLKACGRIVAPRGKAVPLPVDPTARELERKARKRARETKKYQESAEYRAYLSEQSRKRLYGLSAEAFVALINSQGWCCKLCHRLLGDTSRDKPNVDHCHETGKVRGILCPRCNRGLGILGDTAANLQRAADYVKGELGC